MDKVQIIKAIRKFIPEKAKEKILQSLSILERIQLLSQLDWNKDYIFETVRELSDEDKINILDKYDFDESTRLEIAKMITNPGIILQVIDKISDEKIKENLVEKIDDPHLKLKAIGKLAIDTDSIKLSLLEEFEEDEKIEIVRTIKSPEIRLKTIEKLKSSDKLEIVLSLGQPELMLVAKEKVEEEDKATIIENIKNILESDKCEDILLKRLYDKNNKVLQNINYKILNEPYISTLGEDKINLISCFPEIQQKILNLTEKQYKIFEKCLNNYWNQKETDEWTIIASYLLENIENGQYDELFKNIENIEEVDVDKLMTILQFPNNFGIKTIEDIKNFEEIKRQKCDEIINSNGDFEEKQNALLLKLFGQDLQYTKTIIRKYGDDIHNIEDSNEKDYVLLLKEIIYLIDEDTLKQIYEECEEVELVDKSYTERRLKTAYGKLFNKGLYKTENESELNLDKEILKLNREITRVKSDVRPEKIKRLKEKKRTFERLKGFGANIYDAGTDFRMIITSVSPFVSNSPEDFKNDWNRPSLASQHFCASYIRNDMIGLPDMPHLCYGFSEMKEDALMLSGNMDIDSTPKAFVSRARAYKNEKYYSPDEQINKTDGFNEMDFRRIQGGKKKQPDYIVAFLKNGKINNMNKIEQAIEDWGGTLPVVIIDIDECLEQQKKQVDEMLEEYKISKAPEKAKEILQKVNNNRVTDWKFCNYIEVQLKKIKMGSRVNTETKLGIEQFPKREVCEEELKENNEGVTEKERREVINKIEETLKLVQNIVQNKGDDERIER